MSCKSCHSKICRFVKTLDEIAAFKKGFDEILSHLTESHSSSSLQEYRTKRCSKSPHKAGPPLKMLQMNNVQIAATTEHNTRKKSCSFLIDQENLPFKDVDLCNERQPTLTAVDVCTFQLPCFLFWRGGRTIMLTEGRRNILYEKLVIWPTIQMINLKRNFQTQQNIVGAVIYCILIIATNIT